jgi:hypothetical protein
VDDDLVLLSLKYLHDGNIVQGALIIRLAAASGVKKGAIQHHRRTIVEGGTLHHVGVEGSVIRIDIIQALGHLSWF